MTTGSSSLFNFALAAFGYLALFQGVLDVVLLVGLCAVRSSPLVQQLLETQFLMYFPRALEGIFVSFVLLQVCRVFWSRSPPPKWSGIGKVLLFPCQTTHSRFFPEKHSFTHSYLVVGIPVGWEGAAGGLVSAGVKEKGNSGILAWFSLNQSQRKGWYDTDAGDYLDRGKSHLGLRGKLDEFLKTQGVDPASFPHAYLITAARFLGYHFNPVSFWYLYDSDKSLAAMILEVNNTFDERRMYFLTPADEDAMAEVEGSPTSSHTAASGKIPRTVMKQVWPKELHVSPFNSRKGSYSLVAYDPLRPSEPGSRLINNTITLKSSKGHGKIVARLFSDGPPIDPASLSWWQKLKFLASWWWVGFVTFPRIVSQAWVLFFRRKLHVWYRPEPLKESIGRRADGTERRLELVFRRYLRHLVEASDIPVAVKYIPSGLPDGAEELMLPRVLRDSVSDIQALDFKVLTPVFYSRFACYAHDLEAIFCEFRENCTVWISHPEMIPRLFLKAPLPPLKTSNYVDFAYFKAIQRLRRNPEKIERPLTSSAAATARGQEADMRGFRISSMDSYVLTREETETKNTYRSAVLKLFIADRISLGFMPLLEAQRLAIQMCMVWIISSAVRQAILQVSWYGNSQLAA